MDGTRTHHIRRANAAVRGTPRKQSAAERRNRSKTELACVSPRRSGDEEAQGAFSRRIGCTGRLFKGRPRSTTCVAGWLANKALNPEVLSEKTDCRQRRSCRALSEADNIVSVDDVNGRGGVFVNGVHLLQGAPQHTLKPGDRISFGSWCSRVAARTTVLRLEQLDDDPLHRAVALGPWFVFDPAATKQAAVPGRRRSGADPQEGQQAR